MTSIILGGKAWEVPVMVARQNKVVDPLILGLLPLFSELQKDRIAGLAKVGEKEYDNLLTIAYIAVSHAPKGQPATISKDDFLDLPITLPELIASFSAIAEATGMFSKSEGRESPGES